MHSTDSSLRSLQLNTLTLSASITIIGIMAGLTYLNWIRYRHARDVRIHNSEIESVTDSLADDMLDSEYGLREFLLTGEKSYLGSYTRAIGRSSADLAKLHGLLGQAERLRRLDAVVDQKMSELRDGINSGRAQGSSATASSIRGGQRLFLMIKLREICSAILRQAEAEQDQTSEDAFAAARGQLIVMGVGALFLIMVLLAGYIAINRTSVARELALADARLSRESLQSTLASIGDAVVSTDAQCRIVFANGVALNLLGWPELELIGKPIESVFRIVNEVTHALVQNPVTTALQDGGIIGLPSQTALVSRDGTEIPIEDRAPPFAIETERSAEP